MELTYVEMEAQIAQYEKEIKEFEEREIFWRRARIQELKMKMAKKDNIGGKDAGSNGKEHLRMQSATSLEKLAATKVDIRSRLLLYTGKEVSFEIFNGSSAAIFANGDIVKNTLYLEPGHAGIVKITKAKAFAHIGNFAKISIVLKAKLRPDGEFNGDRCDICLPIRLASDQISSIVDYDKDGQFVVVTANAVDAPRLMPQSKSKIK